MGLARCGTVFPVSVVGAAVPAAVCRWGLRSRCPGVGRCFGGMLIIIRKNKSTIEIGR